MPRKSRREVRNAVHTGSPHDSLATSDEFLGFTFCMAFRCWLSYPSAMVAPPPHRINSLYVHVPFCARKCSYCAFYSEASSGELISRYVAALIRELELVADDLEPRTIFFGGGTPSLLNLHQWKQILDAMARLDLLGAQEWT